MAAPVATRFSGWPRADGPKLAWRTTQLTEGQRLDGIVVRLPMPGVPRGNSLVLDTGAGTVGIPATARKGHLVLERRLAELQVQVGERIVVTYRGMRPTADGERSYRLYEVERRGD